MAAALLLTAALSLTASDQGGEMTLSTDSSGVQLHGWKLRRASETSFAPEEAGGGLVFNEPGDMFIEDGPALELPPEDFTISAWVTVEAPLRWGGIAGSVQDNGGAETGWVLGYDEERFTIGLASEGADDGDGHMTYLRGETPWELGRWHHVAARYDGEVLELFVDGRLDASTREQSGPVLHAGPGGFVIGAYMDRDERHVHDGRIDHLRLVGEARSHGDLQAEYRSREELTRLAPWDDTPFEWLVAPYLTWPALDAISVGFETTEPSSGRIRYRREDVAEWSEVELEGQGMLHVQRLGGLDADTKYFYQCLAQHPTEGLLLESPVHTFLTASSPGRAFTFVVIGDTQSQAPVVQRVSELAREHRPNLFVHAGDLVGTGSSKSDWTGHFFPSAAPLLATVPLMPVLGNHEQDAQHYYDYMSLPDPERWYSFRYGDAEFFMLDGNRSLAQQSEQLEWLAGALSASTASWRFAVLHQPPYTSDSNDYGDTATTTSSRGDMNVRNIVELLEQHDVDMCFSGHVHDYERTFPIRDGEVVPYEEGGVVYVTAAGGGGHLEDFDSANTWFGHKKARRHHLVYVALHGEHLELQAIDEDGRLFDVLTLRKRAR